ncbi:MAG: hypothetical protein HY827_09040 [Actinobacteria bacterium]|nr:hypothetical protein [Actinomycetota bacterium]
MRAARPGLQAALAVAMLAAIAAPALSGCGGDDPAPPAKPIVLKTPSTPTDANCGLTGAGSSRDAEKPPTPGTYHYETTGTRALLGEKDRITKLPRETQMIVTGSISKGAQRCFTTQRRFESNLGDTGVFVINGQDTLLRTGSFQAGADITEIVPDPPMTVLSGSDLEWSGSFDGLTKGRYRAEIVDRKRMRVGGKSVQVVGVKMNVRYSGDVEGFERSTRWVSVKDRLVVAETVEQKRAFGLDSMRLKYSSKLVSLDPS